MLGNDSSSVDLMLSNPKRALISMSVPLIVSLLITSFYNLIDAAWVSGLGADALAGVGFFTPIFMILVGFGNGLGSGAAFAISKYLGEDDKAKVTYHDYSSIEEGDKVYVVYCDDTVLDVFPESEFSYPD